MTGSDATGTDRRAHAPPPVQTERLSRRYGDKVALADVSLAARPGEILGLLGPNGAGKTTLLRLLLGLLAPTSGGCLLFGRSPGEPAARARVGYLPGELSLDLGLTADAMLDLLDRLRPPGSARPDRARRERLCEQLLLLRSDRRRPLRELSRGTRQKIGLLAALRHDPELLVLDEPTEGLDPLVREAVSSVLGELRGRGRTVLLSSHVLSEVEQLADRVAILRDGRLVAVQSVPELRASLTRRMVVAFGAPVAAAELSALPGVTVLDHREDRFELAVAGDLDPLLAVLARHPVRHLAFPEPDLDEAFVLHYRAAGGAP